LYALICLGLLLRLDQRNISTVIAPANSDSDSSSSSSSSSNSVMATDHTNSGIRSGFFLCQWLLKIRFSALRMAQIPTTDREKIAKSTDAPAWATLLARDVQCSLLHHFLLFCWQEAG
jgi:hypothetical protein